MVRWVKEWCTSGRSQTPPQSAVDLVATDHVPETGCKGALEGRNENGQLVTLVHEDSPELRRIAVFDLVVNNADRKGDHILAMAGGHRHGMNRC